MERTKEYFLKLQEEQFKELPHQEQAYLFHIGLTVKQIANENEQLDPAIKKIRNKAYHDEQKRLFELRNK